MHMTDFITPIILVIVFFFLQWLGQSIAKWFGDDDRTKCPRCKKDYLRRIGDYDCCCDPHCLYGKRRQDIK